MFDYKWIESLIANQKQKRLSENLPSRNRVEHTPELQYCILKQAELISLRSWLLIRADRAVTDNLDFVFI